jgi:hypothetical protein
MAMIITKVNEIMLKIYDSGTTKHLKNTFDFKGIFCAKKQL